MGVLFRFVAARDRSSWLSAGTSVRGCSGCRWGLEPCRTARVMAKTPHELPADT